MKDVDEESGPFTFFAAAVTENIVRVIDYEIDERGTMQKSIVTPVLRTR